MFLSNAEEQTVLEFLVLQVAYNVADNVPKLVYCDAQRLQQILLNVLNNAVKFTEKGEILLEVWCEPEGTSAGHQASDQNDLSHRQQSIDLSSDTCSNEASESMQHQAQQPWSQSQRVNGAGAGEAFRPLTPDNLSQHNEYAKPRQAQQHGQGSVGTQAQAQAQAHRQTVKERAGLIYREGTGQGEQGTWGEEDWPQEHQQASQLHMQQKALQQQLHHQSEQSEHTSQQQQQPQQPLQWQDQSGQQQQPQQAEQSEHLDMQQRPHLQSPHKALQELQQQFEQPHQLEHLSVQQQHSQQGASTKQLQHLQLQLQAAKKQQPGFPAKHQHPSQSAAQQPTTVRQLLAETAKRAQHAHSKAVKHAQQSDFNPQGIYCPPGSKDAFGNPHFADEVSNKASSLTDANLVSTNAGDLHIQKIEAAASESTSPTSAQSGFTSAGHNHVQQVGGGPTSMSEAKPASTAGGEKHIRQTAAAAASQSAAEMFSLPGVLTGLLWCCDTSFGAGPSSASSHFQ